MYERVWHAIAVSTKLKLNRKKRLQRMVAIILMVLICLERIVYILTISISLLFSSKAILFELVLAFPLGDGSLLQSALFHAANKQYSVYFSKLANFNLVSYWVLYIVRSVMKLDYSKCFLYSYS